MSEPIRVLIMDTVMDRGGSEAMTMNYMRNMDRTKVQYDFLVHRSYKGAYEDEILSMGGKIYRICPVYPQFFLRYKVEIRRFLKEHPEYKIIHSNTMELGYFAYKEAHKQGVPVIICHSHNTPNGFDLKMVVRTYFKIRMRKYVTHMFACSQEAGKWLFGKRRLSQVKVIKNAIQAQEYEYDEIKRQKIRLEMGIADKHFVIGHVGRFFPQKNHDFLVDIFYEIAKKKEESILLLVGGGERGNQDPHVQRIKEKVEKLELTEKVIFAGVRSDVPDVMQAMDAFVFPSIFEGFGIAAIEAQASGLPCFVSADVIPQDINLSDLVHYISLKLSAQEWAEYILRHVQEERKSRVNEIVAAGFDIVENAKQMQELYCSFKL